MTVTSVFGGALPPGLHALSLQVSIGAPVENQQQLAGALLGANSQEPLRAPGGCSSQESATAGYMVEVEP